jgi:hypothetical protein
MYGFCLQKRQSCEQIILSGQLQGAFLFPSGIFRPLWHRQAEIMVKAIK